MLTPPPTLNLPRFGGAITFSISYPTVKTRLALRRYMRGMVAAKIADMDNIESDQAVYFCGVLSRLSGIETNLAVATPHFAPHLQYFSEWVALVLATDWSNHAEVTARWDEFQSVHDDIWKAWDNALLEADRAFSGAIPSELPLALLTTEERVEAATPDSPLVVQGKNTA